MSNYIDGFVLPIPRKHLPEYRDVVEKVSAIWKEHGALSYQEFIGDDFTMPGIKSFPEFIKATDEEVIVFGWVEFESKKDRDLANDLVAQDTRMKDLVAPLTVSSKLIFDAKRMVYGGFKSLLRPK